MDKHKWKDESLCLDYDTNLFFEKYEDDELLRPAIDKLCFECPINQKCFSVGISNKEWGVWGGVYIENGQISREYNKHKSKKDWGSLWSKMVISQE